MTGWHILHKYNPVTINNPVIYKIERFIYRKNVVILILIAHSYSPDSSTGK